MAWVSAGAFSDMDSALTDEKTMNSARSRWIYAAHVLLG